MLGRRSARKKRVGELNEQEKEGERERERMRERREENGSGWLIGSGRYRYRGLDSKFKSYYLADAIRRVRIGGSHEEGGEEGGKGIAECALEN